MTEQEKRNREKEIEEIVEGGAAESAYLMCSECGSSREWAEKMIERGIGDVAWSAYLMCHECGSTKEWYDSVVKKHGGGGSNC